MKRVLTGCLLALLVMLGARATPLWAAPPSPVAPPHGPRGGFAGMPGPGPRGAPPAALPHHNPYPVALAPGAPVRAVAPHPEPERTYPGARAPLYPIVSIPGRPVVLPVVPVPVVAQPAGSVAVVRVGRTAIETITAPRMPVSAAAVVVVVPAPAAVAARRPAAPPPPPAAPVTTSRPPMIVHGPTPAPPTAAMPAAVVPSFGQTDPVGQVSPTAPIRQPVIRVAPAPRQAAEVPTAPVTGAPASLGSASTPRPAAAAPGVNRSAAGQAAGSVRPPGAHAAPLATTSVTRTQPAAARAPAAAIRHPSLPIIPSAARLPAVAGGLAQSIRSLPNELSRLPGIQIIAVYPPPSTDAATPMTDSEPEPPLSPAGSAGSIGSGHSGSSFAAALAALLLLSGLSFCLTGWASNFRRPPILSYAPPVPPG